jgi:hypothetical protein
LRSRFGSLRSLLHCLVLSCTLRIIVSPSLRSIFDIPALDSPPVSLAPQHLGQAPQAFNPIRCIFILPIGFQGSCIHSNISKLLFPCTVSPLRIRQFFNNNSCSITPLFRVRVVPRSHLSVLILVTRLLARYLPSSLVFQLNNFSRGVPLTAELRALSRSSGTMATKMDTATVTGADLQNDAPIKRSGGSHVSLNGFKAPQPLAPIRTHMKKKYRHVAAVHSKPRTSCLSHDSQVSPSFLGFRNLMVIVLGMSKNQQL